MKINEKVKVYLSGIGIVLVIGLTVTTMMYPEYFKYPYSYSGMTVKSGELENTRNQIDRNETMLPQKLEEKEQIEQDAQAAIEENEELQRQFNIDDLEYHLPSLLITLEQGAIDAGIKEENYYIDFELIKTNSSSTDNSGYPGDGSERPDSSNRPGGANQPDEESPATVVETPVDAAPITPVTPTIPGTPGQTTEGSEITHDVLDNDMTSIIAMDVVPNIPGISVTTIPIKVTGLTYIQAREYISFLDHLDFVEPSFTDIYSKGNSVSLIVLVHVFHKGGELTDAR